MISYQYSKRILKKATIKIKDENIKSNKTRHNIFGLWSLDLIDKLEEDILKGERKVEVWANSIGVKTVDINNKEPDPFFNINTKEDLKNAIKILKHD